MFLFFVLYLYCIFLQLGCRVSGTFCRFCLARLVLPNTQENDDDEMVLRTHFLQILLGREKRKRFKENFKFQTDKKTLFSFLERIIKIDFIDIFYLTFDIIIIIIMFKYLLNRKIKIKSYNYKSTCVNNVYIL